MDIEELRMFTLKLSRTRGVGSLTFKKLLAEFGGMSNLYEDFCPNSGHGLLQKIKLSNDEKIFKELTHLNVGYKCVWEDDFPFRLKQMDDPPIVIYYKGDWNETIINNSISVVGTRKFTSYGSTMTNKLVSDLVTTGYTIISGMALGIDRLAHEAALGNNGKTIAILAADVSNPSPYANSDIYYRILDNGGLIISEFAHDIPIQAGMFVQRNRIVAGISLGTLIIEAGIDSGALTTADLAFNYNRDVFAVPGNVGHLQSAGCNKLIKENKAKLVENLNDIMLEYGHLNNSVFSNRGDIIGGLNGEERAVYDVLLPESRLVEEISEILNKHISEISKTCTLLELKGILKKDETGKYFISI